MERENKKRVVIISGGLGGIGRALAKDASSKGYATVCLFHKTPPEEARGFSKNLSGCTTIACDIRDDIQVMKMFDETEKKGELWGIVHLATNPIIRKHPSEMTIREFKDQFETQVFGGFNFLIEGVRRLKKLGEGCVLAATSAAIAADSEHTKMAGYISAKFALHGLLRELKKELSATKIRVNSVTPGFLDTPLNKDLPPKFKEFAQARRISGKLEEPEEVASRLVSLLDPGSHVNGMSVALDGTSTKL